MAQRHQVVLEDADVKVVERALRCMHAVVGIQILDIATREQRDIADTLARVAGRVQLHTVGGCGCPSIVKEATD